VETARLHLRLLAAEDLDALVELDGFEAVRASVDPFSRDDPRGPGGAPRVRTPVRGAGGLRRSMTYARPWAYKGLPGAEYEALRDTIPGDGGHERP
jgi:hypothetical protein